jgi:hypothetical protein
MAICKNCNSKYSFLKSHGDGLCLDCSKKYVEKSKLEYEETQSLKLQNANEKIISLLSEITGGKKIKYCAIGVWISLGHKVSQTAHLWVGRVMFGILGDMMNTDTMQMSLLAVSEKGELYIAHLGDTVEISPERIISATFDKSKVIKSFLTSTQFQVNDEGKLLIKGLPNDESFTMIFHSCFVEGNEKFPT